MKIRRATSKDLVSIQKMEGRIFNNPWSNKSIRNELKRGGNSLNLVAEMDQKIIGYFFASSSISLIFIEADMKLFFIIIKL